MLRGRHAKAAIGALGGAPYEVTKRVKGVPDHGENRDLQGEFREISFLVQLQIKSRPRGLLLRRSPAVDSTRLRHICLPRRRSWVADKRFAGGLLGSLGEPIKIFDPGGGLH